MLRLGWATRFQGRCTCHHDLGCSSLFRQQGASARKRTDRSIPWQWHVEHQYHTAFRIHLTVVRPLVLLRSRPIQLVECEVEHVVSVKEDVVVAQPSMTNTVQPETRVYQCVQPAGHRTTVEGELVTGFVEGMRLEVP